MLATIAVEVRSLPVAPRVIAPEHLSRMSVQGVERAAARAHEQDITRDRGGREHSALGVEAPQHIASWRRRCSRGERQEADERTDRADDAHLVLLLLWIIDCTSGVERCSTSHSRRTAPPWITIRLSWRGGAPSPSAGRRTPARGSAGEPPR